MNPIEEYNIRKGTMMGEIRHEIYQKHGEEAYRTADYGWYQVDVDTNKFKLYTLVNSNPVQFLVATATCPLIDTRRIDSETNKPIDVPPMFVMDKFNPTHLHLEWFDANIPFAARDVLEAQGITWTLP